ncbi:AAA family ATPase [Mariniblastus fucicola]|nr:AAA family ATPase [Mariniblastus fucicola]
MSYKKFPIVWWKDRQGTFYAQTVSGESVCAADDDLKKCVRQIKSAILWHSENTYVSEAEFEAPNLELLKVAIRTSETFRERRHLSSEQTWVSVPCVWGKRDDGSVVCNAPTIELKFQCDSEDKFREIAREEIQSRLNGCSQAQLASMLPENGLIVDVVNVKLGESKDTQWSFDCENLETVANPLTGRHAQKQFSAPINRDEEVASLHRRLRLQQGNLLIVGPRGVGKSTIVAAAARKFQDTRRKAAKESAAESEIDTAKAQMPSMWMCSADRIVAGMRYLGEWEQRLERVIEELAEFQGILCFERLDALCRLGGEDASASIASFLAPFIQNRELRVIVEATREELDQCRLLLPGFENLFEVFEVEPMPEEQARQLLDGLGKEYTRNHKIEFEPESAVLCQRLFKRFMPYDTFPGKCVGFWKGLFETAKRDRAAKIGQDNVVSAFIDLTGLPESLIRDKVSLPTNEIRDWFAERIIGQPDPCNRLTDVIATFKAGLNDPNRPIGIMLFCGPTGVGKTETVKALTRYMFGNATTTSEHEKQAVVRDRLVRLDMSEFAGIGAAQRLTIQSNGQPGELVKRLRQQPFSIVLLDEIEKASSDVFDVLMGVMDEGRLTDKWGRVTDFRSSIIIMTSNLGVQSRESVGFKADTDSGFEAGVRKFFRPEFFNRIDRIVSFAPLSRESVARIAELELQAMTQREGFSSRRLKLNWNNEVTSFLASQSYSKKLGARPLQRTIEQQVSTRIARILAAQPGLSDSTFALSISGGELLVDVR